MQGQRKPTAYPADDEIFIQPWFLPKPVSAEIRKLLPNIHLTKMRYYFEDHGCIRCEGRDKLYGSNGFCEDCSPLVRRRIVTCLQKRLKKVGVAGTKPHANALTE
jgi:hypothetical protein